MIVYQGDTLVAITQHQLKVLNLVKVEYDRYKDLVDNLQAQTKTQNIIIVKKDEVLAAMTDQRKNDAEIITNNTALQNILQAEVADRDKQIKKLKVKNGFLGLGGIAVSVGFIYYVIRH